MIHHNESEGMLEFIPIALKILRKGYQSLLFTFIDQKDAEYCVFYKRKIALYSLSFSTFTECPMSDGLYGCPLDVLCMHMSPKRTTT